MDPLGFVGASYGGYQPHGVALLRQKKELEDEIRAVKDRQRRDQRHERRQIVVKQVQQLQTVLNDVQKNRASGTSRVACARPDSPKPSARDERSHSVEWMLIKLMQQNEELQAIVKNQSTEKRSSDVMHEDAPDRATDTRSKTPASMDPPHSSAGREIDRTDTKGPTEQYEDDYQPRARQAPSPIRGWSTLEILPEVEWTDKDEELLEQLLRGEVDQSAAALPGAAAAESKLLVGHASESDLTSIVNRKQQQQDRLESRRRLTQLFDTSSSSNATGIRRPRWRIEHDAANGVIKPFGENGEGATSEQSMPAVQIFRSAVIAVRAVLELQHLVLEKKLMLREKFLQDFEPMLNLYFDATRVWLGKLVKTPLLSIFQDPSLDIDVSTKSGLFRTPKGISKWFGVFQSAAVTGVSHGSSTSSSIAEHSRAVKLKVRVKGIVDAIVKAVDKGDVPGGIQEFWKRLTSDGVYLPASYPLFEMERQALDLDELGATRSTQDDYVAPIGTAYPRFQIILANFMLLRVLVPHVVLRPWEIGVGSASVPKAVSANLKNVATLLYAIIARVTPLPAVGEDVGSAVRNGIRRRSVDVVPMVEPVEMMLPSPAIRGDTNQEEAFGGGNRFLSISDIQGVLVPAKQFPVDQFELFIIEQQQKLQGVFRGLHARLHPQVSEQEDTRES